MALIFSWAWHTPTHSRGSFRYETNQIASEPPVSALKRVIAQFRSTLVVLLLVATAISVGLWLYERETALPYEAIAIVAVVLLNAVIGFVQEARSKPRSPPFVRCQRLRPPGPRHRGRPTQVVSPSPTSR